MKIKKLLSSCMFAMLTVLVVGQDSLQIGFSLGDFHVDRWHMDKKYFVESANALGAKVYCEYAYGDSEKQIAQIEKLIDLGIKVIAIVPTDANAFKAITDKAHKAGVIIISYDRLIVNADIDYYVSFDNRKVGVLQAGFAVNEKPKGNYILLAGPTTDNNAKEFLAGQKEVLSPLVEKGDINILLEKHLSEWSSMNAFLELQTFFETNDKKIDAVIASNDLVASGVLMAMDMFVSDYDIVLTGQDATAEAVKNIYNGLQDMTIYKPLKKLANASAQLCVDLLLQNEIKLTQSVNNEGKVVPALLLEPIVVTKQNIESTVIADGYYTESEVFGN